MENPASNPRPLAPLEGGQRIPSLDIVRALAFTAVVLVHAAILSKEALQASLAAPLGLLDRVSASFTGIFVQGKGMTCFCILFGVGLFMQLEQTSLRDRPILPFTLRRLGTLFILGVLHYRFIWAGDVLSFYAVVGFALLPFLRARPATMLAVGLGSFLLLSAVPVLSHILGLDPRWSIEVWHRPDIVALGDRPLRALFGAEVPRGLGHGIARLLERASTILPLFLLGASLWRIRLFTESEGQARIVRRTFNICLPLGLVLSFLTHEPLGWFPAGLKLAHLGFWWQLGVDLGHFLLAMAYLTGLLRLLALPGWLERLSFLAPMGRMGLTNYLTQILLLKGFFLCGARLGVYLGPTTAILIAATVYGVQLTWSRAWMSRFRFGPMEWAWRCVTYARLEPLR